MVVNNRETKNRGPSHQGCCRTITVGPLSRLARPRLASRGSTGLEPPGRDLASLTHNLVIGQLFLLDDAAILRLHGDGVSKQALSLGFGPARHKRAPFVLRRAAPLVVATTHCWERGFERQIPAAAIAQRRLRRRRLSDGWSD